jgi:hypothetical protein
VVSFGEHFRLALAGRSAGLTTLSMRPMRLLRPHKQTHASTLTPAKHSLLRRVQPSPIVASGACTLYIPYPAVSVSARPPLPCAPTTSPNLIDHGCKWGAEL